MNDRIVIITGAAGGVGRTVTHRWLEAGASVLAVDGSERGHEVLRAEWSGDSERLETLAVDLTTEEGAAAMVARAREAFGVPDTLIHLVGGFAMGPIDGDDSVANWERMMALNAYAPFHCFRAMVPALRERGGGWIVGLGSRSADAPSAKMAAYAASKAALTALAQSMAAELRDVQIHVNLILASTIDTPANRAAMGNEAAAKWVRPEDIADATMFLCSDQAHAVHGATLEVYGRS